MAEASTTHWDSALAFQDGAFRTLRLEVSREGSLVVRRELKNGTSRAPEKQGELAGTPADGSEEVVPASVGAATTAAVLEGRPTGGVPHSHSETGLPYSTAILPGFVNAHSHAFQRVLRGRVEGRGGDFWSWRKRMYHAALELDPDHVRIVSRAAFLEMLLAGFTGVAEFHYLHNGPLGRPYADPNELGHAVLDAAAEVGIRICLLETAYARAGAGFPPDPAQNRFIDPSVGAFLRRAEDLRARLDRGDWPLATFGLGLHSVRALPRDWLVELKEWAERYAFPIHMHVAEQPAEVEACLSEHGRRPLELLGDLGLLGPRFTAIHGIHLGDAEIRLLASLGAGVCACPSTEGNLGDSFVPAARLFLAGVPVCFGTDSQASIDPFAEMRELDYRERLRSGKRQGAAAAAVLLEAATAVGAERAGWQVPGRMSRMVSRVGSDREGGSGHEATHDSQGRTDAPAAREAHSPATGRLRNGWAADLVVLDLTGPTLCGASPESLPAHLVSAGSPGVVRDVYVGGRHVVREGRHERQEEILRDFADLQRRLWRSG